MHSSVPEIKARLPIEEVVGAYVKLERAGSNLKAKCPFHHEKTASFFVSPARGSFYCFGCQAKGDIFSFVERMEGTDFRGALKTLAERAGVPLARFRPEKHDARERVFEALQEAARFFEGELAAPQAEAVRAYLLGRGVSSETAASWRIGFAPLEWRALRAHLSSRGFSDVEMLHAGLIKNPAGDPIRGNGASPTSNGARPFDVFRNRVMFPIFDAAGRIIAFSGRIFGAEDEQTPKYVNSPETEVWRKSAALYGIDRAKHKIRERGYALIVEGQVDLVLCHQAGFQNAVAASGTALTPEHLDTLRRFSDNLLLAYDTDAAGERATLRAVSAALQKGMAVKIAALSGGKDPADIIAKNPADFAEALKGSMPVVRFLLSRALARATTPREKSRLVREEVFPFVRDVASAIERADFVKEIAVALEVREDAVWEDMKNQKLEVKNQKLEVKNQKYDTVPSALRLLAGMLLWQEGLSEKERTVDIEKIKKELGALSGEALLAASALGETVRDELVFEAEARFAGAPSLPKEARALLAHLERELLEKESVGLLNELTVAERAPRLGRGAPAGEPARQTLLERLHALRIRIEALKRASSEA